MRSTRTVTERRADQLLVAAELVAQGSLDFTGKAHAVAKPGALLIEPLEGSPWVFVEPREVHTFRARPDPTAARIAAHLFFADL